MRFGAPIRTLAALLLGLSLSVGPTLANAQPSDEELARNEQAVRLGERGLAEFRAKDWLAAYASFHAAESLVHSPVFLLYMARVRVQQGSPAEALDLYARIEAEPITEHTPDAWRAAATRARSEAAELRTLQSRNRHTPPERGDRALALQAPRARPRPRKFQPSAAAITAGAVGVAGLALGTTAGLLARHRLNALKERCGGSVCDEAERDELDLIRDWARVADVAFVVAAAGIGTSSLLIWVVPGSTPASGPAAISVTARASF